MPRGKVSLPALTSRSDHVDFRSLLYTVPFHSRLFATAYGDVTCVGIGSMLNSFRLLTADTVLTANAVPSISELPTKTGVNSTTGYFVSNHRYHFCCEGPASLNEIFRDCE